jgi:hypothetical protein
MIPHIIRPATDDDMRLVESSWLRTLATEYGVPEEALPRARFWRANGPGIRDLCRRARVVVACSRADQREVMAWACAEPPGVLHFVFTKQRGTWGQQGLCRALLKHLGMAREATATHYTDQGWPRVARCFDKLTLDPHVTTGRAA